MKTGLVANLATAAAATLLAASTGCSAPEAPPTVAGVTVTEGEAPAVRSVAVRVHDIDAMVAFYSEAFGVTFREVDTFGVPSRFGELGGITLKLVPIREAADFVGYPDLQLGIAVRDIERVLRIAEAYGGRQEGESHRLDGQLHASVRDPDGNTLELYELES